MPSKKTSTGKTDFEQILGIIEEFDSVAIEQAVECIGFVPTTKAVASDIVFAAAGTVSHGISLSGNCKWQQIGRANRDYDIDHRDGAGKLQIYCSTSASKDPDPKKAGTTQIGHDLDKGQSRHVSRVECSNSRYIWVHAKGGAVTGTWN